MFSMNSLLKLNDKGFHKFIEKKTFFYPIKNKLLYL